MSEAYRIKRFHHVTAEKQKRLRDENLVPLIAFLPSANVLSDDIEELLSSDEMMSLKMDEIDALEEHLNVTQNLQEGDWLIDYVNNDRVVYLMKFKQYEHHSHKHLYIKHFAQVNHIFKVQPKNIPDIVLQILAGTDHLGTLPLKVSAMLDKYEVLALAREQQGLKHVGEKLNHDNHKAQGFRERRSTSRNGAVIITKPADRKP